MQVDLNPGDYVYPNVTCVAVYDGDTCYLEVDVGYTFHRSNRNRAGKLKKGYRLLDIDAPEIKPLVTRKEGTAARDYLAALILGRPLLARSVENPDHDQDDDFGRYLVWLRVHDGTVEGFDVNRAMIAAGHAVPYVP